MLEEFWLRANLNSGKDYVLQTIMIGQPELQTTLRLPELRQLAQRVMATYHLGLIALEATAVYVAHRLQSAGDTGQEFITEAARYIHDEVDGIPRMVNKLCGLALVYATSAKEKASSCSRSRQSSKTGLPSDLLISSSFFPIRCSIA